MERIRERHIKAAVAELNERRRVAYPQEGYTYWADVHGSGVYSPRLWRIVNEGGGVTYSALNGATLRETLAKVQEATSHYEPVS